MECEVVIIGLGPVGAMAANLLGQYGVTARVVERNPNIYSAPRAIAIDAEASRVFSMVDLGDWLAGHVYKCGAELRTEPAPHGTLLVDASDLKKQQRYGFQKVATVHQPTVEQKLRERLEFFSNIQVYLEYEAIDILEENGRVIVTIRRKGSTNPQTLSCQYVLACDGGRSFARSKLGLRYKGNQLRERWLVMDTTSSDENFENDWSNATVVCGPKRTFFTVALPQNRRRFEFLLHDDEDGSMMVREPAVARLMADAGLEAHKFVFDRRMVYKFHARQVEQWRMSRVLLVGDAAHCMPPIKGQGMCCGLEGIGNVCWKVTMMIRGTMKNSLPSETTVIQRPHEQLLDSYEMERAPWVTKMTSQNLRLRQIASLRNPILIHTRNIILYLMDHIPGAREWIRFEKYKGLLSLKSGFVDKDSAGSGSMFPRSKVQTVLAGALSSVMLDEVLGYGWCLLVYGRTVGDILSVKSRSELERLGCRTVHILPSGSDLTTAAKGSSEYLIVDEEGVLKSWFRQHLVDAALVRPDRFVFGTVQRNSQGDHLVKCLLAMLSGDQPLSPATGNSSAIYFVMATVISLILCCVLLKFLF